MSLVIQDPKSKPKNSRVNDLAWAIAEAANVNPVHMINLAKKMLAAMEKSEQLQLLKTKDTSN